MAPSALLRRVLPAGALILMACSSSSTEPAAESDTTNVTDVPHTSVKEQVIGNCWLYTTVAWVESLQMRRETTLEQPNYSESYLTYWRWYEILTSSAESGLKANDDGTRAIIMGANFDTATELIKRYGMVEEQFFIEGDEQDNKSERQQQALNEVNRMLNDLNNPLGQKVRDPKTVRQQLNLAWQLSQPVKDGLDNIFGKNKPSMKLWGSMPAALPVKKASQIQVARVAANGTKTLVSLSSELGRWEKVTRASQGKTPDADRALLRRMQKALNLRLPVPVAWGVNWNCRKNATSFKGSCEGTYGGHLSILEDYQLDAVPSYGLLPAGVLITNPDALTASLDDRASLDFLRIKNTWGLDPNPNATTALAGYYDLYGDYLFRYTEEESGLWYFVLPKDLDGSEPAVVDACESKTTAGSYCMNDAHLVPCAKTGSDAGGGKLSTQRGGQYCQFGCSEIASSPACNPPPAQCQFDCCTYKTMDDCNAHMDRCGWFVCSNECYARGYQLDDVCGARCLLYTTIESCNEHRPECAWFACNNTCHANGTPLKDICTPGCIQYSNSKEQCNQQSDCEFYDCDLICHEKGAEICE